MSDFGTAGSACSAPAKRSLARSVLLAFRTLAPGDRPDLQKGDFYETVSVGPDRHSS